jgi:hypothetical protein
MGILVFKEVLRDVFLSRSARRVKHSRYSVDVKSRDIFLLHQSHARK